MNIIDDYRRVAQRGTGNIIRKYPVSHFPQPTDEDYHRGYIIRYFIKLKTNKNSSTLEVDESEYNKFSSENIVTGKSFFQSVSLRWKIIGKRNDVIIGNTKTVEIKELLLPGISLRLGNRLQFWKNL